MTYIKTTMNPIWTKIKPITSEEYAEMENEMVKKTEEMLGEAYEKYEFLRVKPSELEKYNAWEKYIKEEYTDAENEMVKKTEDIQKQKPTKANDYQVGGSHYKDKRVQPWDVIDTLPHAQAIGFYKGNAIKYIMRAGDKGPAKEDYEKAKHYLTKLLEIL